MEIFLIFANTGHSFLPIGFRSNHAIVGNFENVLLFKAKGTNFRSRKYEADVAKQEAVVAGEEADEAKREADEAKRDANEDGYL